MAKRRRRFTPTEEATLVALAAIHFSAREVAEALGSGRSRASVIARANRLGVRLRPDPEAVAAYGAERLAAYWNARREAA